MAWETPQGVISPIFGLKSHGSHELTNKLLRLNAYDGVLSFGVMGDVTTTMNFVGNLKLASHLANVGV